MDENAIKNIRRSYVRFTRQASDALRAHWVALVPLTAPFGIELVRGWLSGRVIGCRDVYVFGQLEPCIRFARNIVAYGGYIPRYTFVRSPDRDLVARYEFMALLLLSIVGAIVAIGICVWILRVIRTSFNSRTTAWGAAGVFFVALTVSAILYARQIPVPYANVVQRALWPFMPAFFDPETFGFIRAAVSFILFGLVGAAAGSIILAAEKATNSEALQALYLRLHVLLYIGAATLALYVIQQRTGAGWAMGYVVKDDAPSVAAIVTAMTMSYGLASSLMLSAIYAPVAITLSRRSSELARQALPNATYTERREWAASVGLTPGVPQQLGTVLSLLGPILAGGPIDALKALFG